MFHKISVLLCIFFLAGCSAANFNETSFRLSKQEDGFSYYTYQTFAAADLPLDSTKAEEERMNWLKKWLEQNHLSKDYVIVDKQAYIKHKGLFGTVYDLYDEVRVPSGTKLNSSGRESQ